MGGYENVAHSLSLHMGDSLMAFHMATLVHYENSVLGASPEHKYDIQKFGIETSQARPPRK